MKKILTVLLALSLIISGCSGKSNSNFNESDHKEFKPPTTYNDEQIKSMNFKTLDNEKLLRFLEDDIYSNIVKTIDNDTYFVQNVEANYISKEYIEELEFNSKENIYFGYNLKSLEKEFKGTKYVFTLGEDNKTIVKAFEGYDDTYEKALKNIAIGSGVILVCVTVSVVTAGTAPAMSMIFSASAKTATTMALSSSAIGALSSGVITAVQTGGDMDAVLKSATLAGSEGFKWGAITGAVSGGVNEAVALKGATLNGLTMNEAATIQKESGYPLDIIKQIKSIDEYNVYKNAGLKTQMIDGKLALVQNIDLNFKSELSGQQVTNLERMLKGYAPIEPTTGKAYQLHHIGQKADATLAILTESQHQGNAAILNVFGKDSEIDRKVFESIRKAFWKDFAANAI